MKKIKIVNQNTKNFLIAFIILIIVTVTILLIIISKRPANIVVVSSIIYNNEKNNVGIIKSIKDETSDYEINAWYKKSNIKKLDEYMLIKINEQIDSFKLNIKLKIQNKVSNIKYYLKITFDEYNSKNYISYVVNSVKYTGDLSSDNNICCINYDKRNDKIIFLSDIINSYSKNKNEEKFLNTLSNYVYNELKNNAKIKNFSYKNLDILKENTKPVKENFNNFVIDDKYIHVFFERGAVAPNVLGIFEIKVPISIFN